MIPLRRILVMGLGLTLLSSCGQSQKEEEKFFTWEDLQTQNNVAVGEYYQAATVEKKEYTSLEGIAVDIDLRDVSSTIAFSQVQLLMYVPQDYWGSRIRIDGVYYPMDTPEFGLVHVLLILDDTLCCQGYLEFILPEDGVYPEFGSQIGLVGTYTLVEDAYGGYSLLVVSDYEY